MIFAVLMIAACFLTVFTLLPLWRCEAWWVRSLDFPRMQLTVIALLLLVLECWLLDWHRPQTWGLSLVTLLCFAYQAWWIVPYTKLFPVEVKSTTHADNRRLIRILTANVLTPNRNAKGLMDLVRENTPDIVVTLESDSWWQSKLDALQPDFPIPLNVRKITFTACTSTPDCPSKKARSNIWWKPTFRQSMRW
jgi:endonuclease/exonuclease/phosphatase (EEP) superfamily protein YafD